MAQQLVNVGNTASDGTGDELRDAFTKINENFTEVYGTAQNGGLTYGNVSSNVVGITFNVTRYTESYSATPVLKGTGQSIGNLYVIRGNVLGGTTPVNDVYLTVTTLANATVGNIATVSATGVPTAPVLRVNGLTGNVTLTVNNIDGAASKAYVNSAIAANIANVSGATYNSINANVAASNLVISNHSARITTLESNAASQALQINSLVSVKANVSYVDVSIDNALSSSAIGSNLLAINANITAANAAIVVLQTNAATQAVTLNTLTSNAASQAVLLNTLLSNAATQADTLTTLVSNASIQSADLSALFANTIAQETKIGLINSNVATINVSVNNLFSNAADQDATLSTLIAANATQSSQLNTLTANAASQAASISSLESTVSGHTSSINTLTANAASQAVSITSLQSNAASQAVDISSISSYTSTLLGNVVTLTANAATQAIEITGLSANITAANSAISGLATNANVGTLYLGNISTNANLGAYQIFANSNAASQALSVTQLTNTTNLTNVHIGNLYANVSSLQANIITRANVNSVNGASFVGNVQAPNLIASNLYVTTAFIGIDPGTTYPSWGGTVIGDVDSPYNFNLQNRSNGSTASGSFTVFSNDAANYLKLEKLNTNSNNLLFENSGLSVFPSDGGVSVVGGNAFIRSTRHIFFVANTTSVGIFNDGTVYIGGSITSPGDLTVGNVTASGNIAYTMGNAAHWTTSVTTVAAALDQLASRIWNIENP